jgi:phage tail sheath gpL-like
VAPFVGATSLLGVVTVTADNKGVAGNTITLAASGTGATASGVRLTGGSESTAVTVTI